MAAAAAPWLVRANHKWCRNWGVSRILTETLTAMDPQCPEPTDLDHYEIPDV